MITAADDRRKRGKELSKFLFVDFR